MTSLKMLTSIVAKPFQWGGGVGHCSSPWKGVEKIHTLLFEFKDQSEMQN